MPRYTLVLLCLLLQLGSSAQYLADHVRPDPTEELYVAGERAYRSGDQVVAINLFDQVLEQDPEHLNALLQRGFCHSLNASYDEAVDDFTAVIDHKNDHLWAYTSRGSAYSKLGKYDLAIADFDRVIELDPKNEEAYNNRGWARKANGDPKGACKDWNSSKRLGNAEAKIILKNNRCK
ncbi:MAG: tetratricopeptide repeat protein [Flavobacteriales bacterium]|jgi:tetratricopeptide (TPR) repeat protein|nr:tetratricopeptide repeat protein [Flavobacteriales bacterium]MBK6882209.1 tetratricopeptide repeat protein [Flavobacteriales bacterium]MBK7101574.1 tetratricopeptide repeat protein [Flavobacteriales bacterium]MBK7112280.1 tetratricopeptide repeat protein [Flavobacteriales bacterium]MBK7618696.1 tetratricopeptide repeat protein [Flavobacteriales bacterium]